MSERLFIGAVFNLPKELRQRGRHELAWRDDGSKSPYGVCHRGMGPICLAARAHASFDMTYPDPAAQAESHEKTIWVTPKPDRANGVDADGAWMRTGSFVGIMLAVRIG